MSKKSTYLYITIDRLENKVIGTDRSRGQSRFTREVAVLKAGGCGMRVPSLRSDGYVGRPRGRFATYALDLTDDPTMELEFIGKAVA